ncbi:MAG: hypothetical protein M3P41_04295 [Actinomycetota bacterium]|nr:hypothetical protein [Actinomycetota bacterium]
MDRRSLRYAGAASVAALAIVASGCGSGGSSSASSTTTATNPATGASTAALKSFQDCMASHGVKNFTPGAGRPSGGGGLSTAQQEAFRACRSKLPAGARPGGAPAGGNKSNPAFAKYAACLKQHGVTLGASNDQKAFAKASAACAKLAPAAGGSTQQ